MVYKQKNVFLTHAICRVWLEKRHGKNEKPGRSEKLGRKGGRVQRQALRRRSKSQYEESSGEMSRREGLESGTLQFAISGVEQ